MKQNSKYGVIRRHPKKSNGFYECNKCGENFNAEYKMWDHEQKHVDEDRLKDQNSNQSPSPLMNRFKRLNSRSPSPLRKNRSRESTSPRQLLSAGSSSTSIYRARDTQSSSSGLEPKTPERRPSPGDHLDLPDYKSPSNFLKGRDGSPLLPHPFKTPDKSQNVHIGVLSPSLSQIKTPTLFKMPNSMKDGKEASPLSPLVSNSCSQEDNASPLAIPIQKTPKRMENPVPLLRRDKTPNKLTQQNQEVLNTGNETVSNVPLSIPKTPNRTENHTSILRTDKPPNRFSMERSQSVNSATTPRKVLDKPTFTPTQLKFKSPGPKEHSPRFMGQHIMTSMFPGHSPESVLQERNSCITDKYEYIPIEDREQQNVHYRENAVDVNGNVKENIIAKINSNNDLQRDNFVKPAVPTRNNNTHIQQHNTQSTKRENQFDQQSIPDDVSSIWDEENFDDDDDDDTDHEETQSSKPFVNKLVKPKMLGDGIDHIHTCTYCGKSFKYRTLLARHVRKHTNSKPYGCDQCGKRFRMYDNMIRHYRVHTGEKPYKCGQCDRYFRDQSNLRQHRQSHATTKDFICGKCGRAYKNKRLLGMHNCQPIKFTVDHYTKGMQEEDQPNDDKDKNENDRLTDKFGIDPYEQYDPTGGNNTPKNKGTVYCRLCYYRFKNAKMLEDHLINDHYLKPQDNKEPATANQEPEDFSCRVYMCSICNKILDSLHGLKAHTTRIHKRSMENVPTVQAVEVRTRNKKRNVKKNSQVNPENPRLVYQCTLCGKRVASLSGLKSHSNRMHKQPLVAGSQAKKVKLSIIQTPSSQNGTAILNDTQQGSHADMISSTITTTDNSQHEINFKCPICDKIVGSLHGLKLHMIRLHNIDADNYLADRSLTKPSFHVPIQEEAENEQELSWEPQTQTIQQPETSNSKENDVFIYADALNKFAYGQNKDMYQCKICSSFYATVESMRIHSIEKHSYDPQTGHKYHKPDPDSIIYTANGQIKCPLCPKEVKTIAGLKNHKTKMHPVEVNKSMEPVNENIRHDLFSISDLQRQGANIIRPVGPNTYSQPSAQPQSLVCYSDEDSDGSVYGDNSSPIENDEPQNYSQNDTKEQNLQYNDSASSSQQSKLTESDLNRNILQNDIKQQSFHDNNITGSSQQTNQTDTAFNRIIPKNYSQISFQYNNSTSNSQQSRRIEGDFNRNVPQNYSENDNRHINNTLNLQQSNQAGTVLNRSVPQNYSQNEIRYTEQSKQLETSLKRTVSQSDFNTPLTKQELLKRMTQDVTMLEKMTTFYNSMVTSQTSTDESTNEMDSPEFESNNIIENSPQRFTQEGFNSDEALDLTVPQIKKRVTFADNPVIQDDSDSNMLPDIQVKRRPVANYNVLDSGGNENSIEEAAGDEEHIQCNDQEIETENHKDIIGENESSEKRNEIPVSVNDNSIPIHQMTEVSDNDSDVIIVEDSPKQEPVKIQELPKDPATLKQIPGKLMKKYLLEQRGYHVCQCGCVFKDRLMLAIHRRMHYFDDVLKCSFCEYTFESLMELFRHFMSHEK